MKKIKSFIGYVDDELADSEKYLNEAIACKGIDMLAYDTAIKLAQQEYEHSMLWHDVIVAEIDKERKDMLAKGETIPQYMLDMWEDEHKEYIDEVGKLKYKIEMAKK